MFGVPAQFESAFEPLHRGLKWVYCSPTFPATLPLSVPQLVFQTLDFLPTGAHVLVSGLLWALTGEEISEHLHLRRKVCWVFWVPLSQVSLNPPFCPPLHVMRRREGISNRRRTIGLITHYFRVRGSYRRPNFSCPNQESAPLYSSSGSNSITIVCISSPNFWSQTTLVLILCLISFPTHVLVD